MRGGTNMAHSSKKTVLEVGDFYLKVIEKSDQTTILIRYFGEEINLKPKTLGELTDSIQKIRTVNVAFERCDAQSPVKSEAIKVVEKELSKLLLTYFDTTQKAIRK